MKTPRNKTLLLRLTEDEHSELMRRKTKARLAEWIRETCLSDSVEVRQPVKGVVEKTIPPKLAIEFSKIGSNLNQLAKAMNIAVRYSDEPELKKVAEKVCIHVIEMEQHLDDIRTYILTK